MATCKECLHVEACSGFTPTDLDKDVFNYLQMGCPEEIPDINKRCSTFKDRTEWVEVVRCKDCRYCQRDASGLWCFNDYAHNLQPNDYCSYGERKQE